MIEQIALDRRRFVGLAAAASLATALGARPAAAQEEEAVALLTRAAEAMTKVQSFAFELSTVQGQSTFLQNLELAGVKGEVQRPDRFRADVTARVAIVEVTVKVVGIGTRIWVTDPMSAGGDYIEVTSGSEADAQVLADILNPDRILLTAVGLVKVPKLDGTEDIDGEETIRVTGIFDPRDLAQFARFATPEAGDVGTDLLTLAPMPITIWIDENDRVVSLEIEGPLTRDESPDVVRRLDLFDFDQPVEIEEPTTG